MFPSQDNECARNAHFTAWSENPVFLKIQYFKKETFVRVETFRIFYGPWNLYMGRISDRSYVIHRRKMLFIFGILKIPKIRLFPPWDLFFFRSRSNWFWCSSSIISRNRTNIIVRIKRHRAHNVMFCKNTWTININTFLYSHFM